MYKILVKNWLKSLNSYSKLPQMKPHSLLEEASDRGTIPSMQRGQKGLGWKRKQEEVSLLSQPHKLNRWRNTTWRPQQKCQYIWKKYGIIKHYKRSSPVQDQIWFFCEWEGIHMTTSPERAEDDHHPCQNCGIQFQTPMEGINGWAVELQGYWLIFIFIGIIWRRLAGEVRVCGKGGADMHWGRYQYIT